MQKHQAHNGKRVRHVVPISYTVHKHERNRTHCRRKRERKMISARAYGGVAVHERVAQRHYEHRKNDTRGNARQKQHGIYVRKQKREQQQKCDFRGKRKPARSVKNFACGRHGLFLSFACRHAIILYLLPCFRQSLFGQHENNVCFIFATAALRVPCRGLPRRATPSSQ